MLSYCVYLPGPLIMLMEIPALKEHHSNINHDEDRVLKNSLKEYTCFCCCYVTSVMSNSVRPHTRQPTRLPHPWDSPGKNTGVGCHFLLQCVKVKSESEVAQSCLTLHDPMDCSPPGSSVHGILQARGLERVLPPSPRMTV